MKRISIGGLPFPRLIDEGYYFVDKSMLIADMLGKDPGGVFLFARPRRFGKSTNISMLDAFLNMEYEGNTWFDGLEISRHPEFDRYKNAFPVIRLDLKDTVPERMSYGHFTSKFRDALRMALRGFEPLLESDALSGYEKNLLGSVLDESMPEEKLSGSIKEMSWILEKHYKRRVVVLIDEYDRSITNTFGTDVQRDILEFLGNFMSATLKSNPSLQMGYVTGVMQVAKAGMFSGLNNLAVNNVFSKLSDERFGFTEAEVRELLEYYDHPEMFDEVRGWYDGYRFGDAEVYNPFSVMSYISNGFEPRNYWVNTSGVTPLKWMLERVNAKSIGDVANMVSGGRAIRNVHTEMTYDDLSDLRDEDLYSLMVLTGYLKAVPQGDGLYALSIPNREVMSTMDDMVAEVDAVEENGLRIFAEAMTAGDAEAISSALQKVLSNASYFNLRDESSYALVVLSLLYGVLPGYKVKSEVEAGNGRCDLMLTPKREGVPAMIVELKRSASEADLEKDADAAIAQIRDRRYHLGMRGDVVLVGISFWGKVPSVRTEAIRNRPRRSPRMAPGALGRHPAHHDTVSSPSLSMASLILVAWTRAGPRGSWGTPMASTPSSSPTTGSPSWTPHSGI